MTKALQHSERREIDLSEHREDLVLLREVDQAGRVPGAPVPTVDEAIAYLRELDSEASFEDWQP